MYTILLQTTMNVCGLMEVVHRLVQTFLVLINVDVLKASVYQSKTQGHAKVSFDKLPMSLQILSVLNLLKILNVWQILIKTQAKTCL